MDGTWQAKLCNGCVSCLIDCSRNDRHSRPNVCSTNLHGELIVESSFVSYVPVSDHHESLALVSLATPDANVRRNSSQRTSCIETLSWQRCHAVSCRPRKLSGATSIVRKPASSSNTSLTTQQTSCSLRVQFKFKTEYTTRKPSPEVAPTTSALRCRQTTN